jgi:hypothetical protein
VREWGSVPHPGRVEWAIQRTRWHGGPQHGSVGWRVTKMSLKSESQDKKSNFIVFFVKNVTVFKAKPRVKGLAHNLH